MVQRRDTASLWACGAVNPGELHTTCNLAPCMERERDVERITMFAKLKKKIAEEAATAPWSGVRMARTISKESLASMGADSGDDFVSEGKFAGLRYEQPKRLHQPVFY